MSDEFISEEIKIISLEEQEDGSAIVQLEMSDRVKSLLIEHAFVHILRRTIALEKGDNQIGGTR